MKRKMLALISAFTILGATSKAVEPYAFGVKIGAVNNMLMGIDKAKVVGENESQFLSLGFAGALYGEYAFHENVGVALEAGYFMGTIANFKTKGADKDKYKIDLQGIKFLPMLKYYPMGREDENGILQVFVGGDITMPLSGKGQKNDETAVDIKKDDLNTVGFGAIGGVGYEFPFGLLVDLRASYSFTDLFKEEVTAFKKKTLAFADPKKEQTSLFNYGLTVGYNIGVLLEE